MAQPQQQAAPPAATAADPNQQYDPNAYDYYGSEYAGYYAGQGGEGTEDYYRDYYAQQGYGQGYEMQTYDDGTYGATSDANSAALPPSGQYDPQQGNPMQYLYDQSAYYGGAETASQGTGAGAAAPNLNQSQQMLQPAAPVLMRSASNLPPAGLLATPAGTTTVIPPDLRQQLLQLTGKSPGTHLEEYVPPSDGWWADLCTEAALSLGFRLYLSYLLYSAFVLFCFIGLDYAYATMYRAFVPPDQSQSSFAQTTAFLAIFLPLTIFIVGMLCVTMDMMRDFWNATRQDTRLWGFGVWEKKAPWPLHGFIVILTTIVPLIWALAVTLANTQSFFYFWQFFFYVAQCIVIFLVMVIYIWMWFRAAREKGRALARRAESPDERPEVARAHLIEAGGQPDVLNAEQKEDRVETWYRSRIVMSEYGLDQSTIIWMMVILVLSFGPMLIILAFLSTEGDTSIWDAGWIVIAVLFFCLLIILHQAAISKHKGISVAATLFFIAALFVFGMIGFGAAGNGALFGVFIILLLLTQGTLLRKRQFQMTRREIYHHFKRPFDEEYEAKREGKLWDSYYCCCKNVTFLCLGCFDIKTLFGYVHPEVRALEKKERKNRMSLRSDQNVIAVFWWIFCLSLLVLLGFSRNMLTWYTSSVAVLGSSVPTATARPALPICQSAVMINAKGGERLTLYEMSLLATLSYTNGLPGKNDFATWFGPTHPNLTATYRSDYPYNIAQASDGSAVEWTEYTDGLSGFKYIVIRGVLRARPFMRNLDVWGDSLTLQFAGVFAPHISAWPEHGKAEFINGISFLKKIYGYDQPTRDLENYILTLGSANVVVIGHGFNGGLAEIAAARTGAFAVSFDAPGIGLLYKKMGFSNPTTSAIANKAITVYNNRNLFWYIDQVGASAAAQPLACSKDAQQICIDMKDINKALYSACGDVYLRQVK